MSKGEDGYNVESQARCGGERFAEPGDLLLIPSRCEQPLAYYPDESSPDIYDRPAEQLGDYPDCYPARSIEVHDLLRELMTLVQNEQQLGDIVLADFNPGEVGLIWEPDWELQHRLLKSVDVLALYLADLVLDGPRSLRPNRDPVADAVT